MGRVEEALRRAGAREPAEGPVDGAFVAPWAFTGVGLDERRDGETGPGRRELIGRPDPSVVPSFSRKWAERLVRSTNADPALVEQFRTLGATLHRLQTTDSLKVLVITSTGPAEGKTLTSVNLALTLSESYRRRVLLVDADLRRPSIHEISQISDSPGLSEVLKASTDQKLTLLRLTEHLTLLPAGRPDPDPMSGLTSGRMQRIIAEARRTFDWVILDAPPVAPIADASLLAGLADATLFVVRAGVTQLAAVQKAIESIGRDRILGVVLNGAERSDATGYARYYGPASDAPAAQ